MSIKYKGVSMARPGIKGGGAYKYYPRIYDRRKINLREISKIISSRCSLHSADIFGTLTALVEVIPELLLLNNTVELGDLGLFSLHIKGYPSDSLEKLNEHSIKEIKMAFRPGKQVKQRLENAHFTKA